MQRFIPIICLLCGSMASFAQGGKHLSEKDSLEVALKSASDTNKVIVLNKLSFQYLRISDYEKALGYSSQAFALSEQLDYKKGKGKSLINSGNVFFAQSELEKAKDYYQQALEIGREILNYQIIDHSFNNLGEIFREQGNYEKALSYYLESLKLSETRGDKQSSAETLNNIGLIHSQMKNYKKAIECYEGALKVSRELNNKYDISANLINLGHAYYASGDPEKSLLLFRQALALKKEINSRDGMAATLLAIGNVYFKQKNLDAAFKHYQQAIAEANQVPDKATIARCLNNIGNIYEERKDYRKAIEHYKKFLELSIETGTKENIRDAYFNLAEPYAMLNDFKTAFGYHSLYTKLNDSLFNIESSKQIANMQAKYESEKKEKEIKSLKKEHVLQMQANRSQKMLFGGILIFIFMGSVVFYLRAQVNKQKNIRLTEKIDAQNRELSTIAMLVSKKNNALAQLKEKLEKISIESSTSEKVTSVLKDIGNEIAFDEEWDTFKYHFEKVHPEFFTKLKQAAPGLSVTELRLCAYLKSNLSTKEISQLTNTTVRSVQQAKYRVNQKFKESAANLSDFL